MIFPWWVPILLSVVGLFIFDNFYEVLFIGFLLDVFYGSRFVFENWPYFFTSVITLASFIIIKTKKNFIFYR